MHAECPRRVGRMPFIYELSTWRRAFAPSDLFPPMGLVMRQEGLEKAMRRPREESPFTGCPSPHGLIGLHECFGSTTAGGARQSAALSVFLDAGFPLQRDLVKLRRSKHAGRPGLGDQRWPASLRKSSRAPQYDVRSDLDKVSLFVSATSHPNALTRAFRVAGPAGNLVLLADIAQKGAAARWNMGHIGPCSCLFQRSAAAVRPVYQKPRSRTAAVASWAKTPSRVG